MIKIYQVGGCVRDEIMGKEASDFDYVIVGATPEDLIKKGFIQVGADFPVFLHPETKDEYALARTERKTGHGYNGFETSFDSKVTLEDDLLRRDLTINAMAKDSTGKIIDPFNGKKDIENRILKHVSNSFTEDPLRILRVCRFSARFDFNIHEKTMELMQLMHKNQETKYLTKERIWKEYSRVLKEDKVSLFYKNLDTIGLGKELFYSFQTYKNPEFYLSSKMDDYLSNKSIKEKILFQILPSDFNHIEPNYYKNLKDISVTKEVSEFIKLSVKIWDLVNNNTLNKDFYFDLLIKCDASRRKERFIESYNSILDFYKFSNRNINLPEIETIKSWIQLLDIDAKQIANEGDKNTIGERIFQAKKESFFSNFNKKNLKI